MFVLGVFVGRDSAPVKFDTRKFQKKLAHISERYEEEYKDSEDTDIHFYEALQKPMPSEKPLSDSKSSFPSAQDKPDKVKNKPVLKNSESKAKKEKKIALKVGQKSKTKSKYFTETKKKQVRKKISPVNKTTVTKKRQNKAKGKFTIHTA